MKNRHIAAMLAGTSLVTITMAPAFAQDVDDEDEIVVTGTQIRGIAPAGVQVIGLTEEAIESTGATSGTELLSQIPQVSNFFNSIPGVGGNSAQFVGRSGTSRPNLRTMPNSNTANAPFTLVLVDGHRMVPTGIQAAAGFDPDSIAPSLVQRAEVMPDGASAIYGSDAVAGVINYITRDSFDGIQITANYGGSNIGYETGSAGLTGGTSWGSGNAFFSINASRHDALYGRDLDYIANIDYNPASPTFGYGGLGCFPGNVTISTLPGQVFPLNASGFPQASTLIGNRCDIHDNVTIVPKQETIGFMGGLTQDITNTLAFDVRAWVQRRENVSNNGYFAAPAPFVGGVTISSANANYRPAPGVVGTPTQTLNVDFSSVLGLEGRARFTDVDWWQISPRLTWDLGADWQLRALYSHGVSEAESTNRDLNTGSIQTAINAGSFNPYTMAGPTTGFISTTFRSGEFAMDDVLLIADGPLFALPGGDVRLAVGAQYNALDFDLIVPGLRGADEQRVTSFFGEMQVPIFGASNALPLFQSLLVSASVRQDHYESDSSAVTSVARSFSSEYETTNPSIGITWDPVDWLTLRGTWGTSFTSPNALDRVVVPAVNVADPNPDLLPWSAQVWPYGPSVESTLGANAIVLTLTSGSRTDLQPQTSENWSAGFDFRAPFLEGLTMSGTFFSVHVDDMLTTPGGSLGVSDIIQNYPQLIIANGGAPLTPAQIQSYLSQTTGLSTAGVTQYATTYQNCAEVTLTCPVAYIADNRTQNLQELWIEGVDFSVRYDHDTNWGSWDVALSGTTDQTRHSVSGNTITDLLDVNSPIWRWSLTGGVNLGDFRAQATWQHTDGFDTPPGTTGLPGSAPYGQSKVDPYDQIDLFFRYDFGALGPAENTSIRLNVNNVFDEEPPAYRGGFYPGIFNGDASFVLTSGRYIQLGLTSSF